ncbi:hypothetical protein [Prochlorococcus marinus]|nr:hypothetical protein [Prochlorococcus marinus]
MAWSGSAVQIRLAPSRFEVWQEIEIDRGMLQRVLMPYMPRSDRLFNLIC